MYSFQGLEINYHMPNEGLHNLQSPPNIYYDDHNKEDEFGEALRTHGNKQKCVQSLGKKT
jgi:hypothetical protein